MRISIRALAALFPILVVLGTFGDASGQSCWSTCRGEVKECRANTRAPMNDCRDECGSTAMRGELGACVVGCTEVSRTTKRTCRSVLPACREICLSDDPEVPPGETPPETPPGHDDEHVNSASCFGQCGQALGACAHEMASGGSDCIRGCGSAPDRKTCIHDCTASAKDDGRACKEEARACREACGLPGGSTTTTFGVPTTTVNGPTTTTTGPTTTTTSGPTTTTTVAPTTTSTTLPIGT